MIVFPRGEVRTWSDLTPGALFGVSISGETHLGVKIQGRGGEFHCAVLTGLPPALGAGLRPSALGGVWRPASRHRNYSSQCH